MRNSFIGSIVAVAALLACSPDAVAQRPLTLYQKLLAAGNTGGPAPKRDLTGFWTGPLTPKMEEKPPLTPLGQQRFKANVPDPFSEQSNDPWATCDPLGFPRSSTNETRGVAFAQMPGRLVILNQYQRTFRTAWMDGRELPKNVGAKGGPNADWYGYSVARWDGDYTLVVNTVGLDERSWMDRRGYPHSEDLRVEERYTRVDHDTLDLTLTVEDPKMYTKPFVLATNRYKWIPDHKTRNRCACPRRRSSIGN